MKKLSLLLGCLYLASCANLVGTVSGGFYTSANKEFKVMTPAIPKLSAQDGALNDRVFVDFYQSRGFWKKYGLYSVEWSKSDKEIKSDRAFYRYAKNTAESFVNNNYGNRGTFDIVDTRKLKVNNHAAYQFVANGKLDAVDAVWVGTSIKFKNSIALVSIIVHSENASNADLYGATVQTSIPWEKYTAFLNSFIKLK